MEKVIEESVKFESPDHCNMAADFYFELAKKNELQPCIILIHEFYETRKQWGDFPRELVRSGFKVLAYDMRGHGGSDKIQDLTALISDPQLAPFDLDGAVGWLLSKSGVNGKKLGAVGTSLGGSVACCANAIYPENVACACSVSSSKVSVMDFMKHKAGAHRMRGVLFISAKGDGLYAQDANELSKKYTDSPTRVEIIPGSSDHGIGLFNRRPEVKSLIVAWLGENLA